MSGRALHLWWMDVLSCGAPVSDTRPRGKTSSDMFLLLASMTPNSSCPAPLLGYSVSDMGEVRDTPRPNFGEYEAKLRSSSNRIRPFLPKHGQYKHTASIGPRTVYIYIVMCIRKSACR